MMPVNGDAEAQVKAAEAAKVAEIKARQAAEQQAADEVAAKAKADAEKAATNQTPEQKAAEIAAAKKQVKANVEAAKAAEASKPAGTNVPMQTGDNPAQAKAREALANSLFNMSADTPVTPVATAASSAQPGTVITPVPVAQPMKMVIAPAPIGMAPPLPISMEKQQKLQALLAKYRMDQVTPEEYQKQRAAILAEP